MTDDAFSPAIELIDRSSRLLIATHIKPDGDACGTLLAMAEALRARGKKVQPIFLSPIPQWYEFLFDEPVPVLGREVGEQALSDGTLGDFDLILIVDTNSYTQLPGLEPYLRQSDTPILVIDHHATSDGLGTVQIVETAAAATGLVVYDLLKSAGWPITDRMAESLFVAIATDTGWFHFNNTDARVYAVCAELVRHGVEPARVYERLYQNFSPARFRLMVAMLNTLDLQLDGRYAGQQITQADFDRTGAVYSDTENLIDECRRIGSVIVSALFVELKDGLIRCSLRSKGPVDVSAIAAKFGGGGHKMAAGTYLDGPMDHAKKQVYDEVAAVLQ